jgi:hypothetical protein
MLFHVLLVIEICGEFWRKINWILIVSESLWNGVNFKKFLEILEKLRYSCGNLKKSG